jgi:tetratricopeptide (TPR) repeat protein
VSLYRGDFLKGFSTRDSTDFEDWQFLRAESYRRDLGTILDKLIGILSARGAFENALDYASRWIAIDPLHEGAHRKLMELYTWAGFRSAALRQYQECARLLREELDSEPLESTVSLYEAIRQGHVPQPPNPRAAEKLRPTAGGPDDAKSKPSEEGIVSAAETATEYRQRLATVLVVLLRRGESRGFASVVETGIRPNEVQLIDSSSHRAVVVFGGSRTREGDPESALRAAFKLRRAIHAQGWETTVGVNTGNVYMAPATEGQPPDIVAGGTTVSKAFQLAVAAADGQILVSESVYRFTRESCVYEPSEKSRRRKDEISYRALRPALQPRKSYGIEGMLARLIGREYEMLRLEGAVHSLLRGDGGILGLVGEAGVGKSRLLSELRSYALQSVPGGETIRWMEGRCLQQNQTTAYRPFVEMIEQFFGRTADTGRADLQASIERTIAEMQRLEVLPSGSTNAIFRVFSKLLRLENGGESVEKTEAQRAEAVRLETMSGIRSFLQGLAVSRPLVLIFEDLHWADGASMDLIFHMMESVETSQMLIICVYRPDRKHRCSTIPSVAAAKFPDRYVELHPRSLTPEQAHDMAKSLLQTDELRDEVRHKLLESTQGLPFFIEVMTQSLIDTGTLSFDGGQWTIEPGAGSTLPQPIQQVILGRIDTLPQALRNCLDVASTIGRVFPRRLLEAVLETKQNTEEILWELQDVALIYQERVVPEEEYSFRHVLTREALYESIPPRRRRALHALVAETMEALYAETIEPHVEQLAYHWERAREVERAIGYLFRAGIKALKHYANEEVISFLRRGLDLLEEIPDSEEKLRRELEFRTALGIPLVPVYGHSSDEVMDVYRRALDICEQVGDRVQLFHCLHGIRRIYLARAEYKRCEAISRRMFEVSLHIDQPEFPPRGNVAHAETLFQMGRLREAVDIAKGGVRLTHGQRADRHILLFGNDTRVVGLMVQAASLTFLGLPDRATRVEKECISRARDIGHPFTLCAALLYAGLSHYHLGDSSGVLKLSDEIFTIAVRESFSLFVAGAEVLGGWAEVMTKRSGDGIPRIRRGYADYGVLHGEILMRITAAALAEALERTGNPVAGIAPIENEIERSVANGGDIWLPLLYRLRGKLFRLSGEDDGEVVGSFRTAIEIARQYGVRLEVLRSSLELADLLLGQGSSHTARKTLESACAGFESDCNIPEVANARLRLEELTDS